MNTSETSFGMATGAPTTSVSASTTVTTGLSDAVLVNKDEATRAVNDMFQKVRVRVDKDRVCVMWNGCGKRRWLRADEY